jgi:hypothetical protein
MKPIVNPYLKRKITTPENEAIFPAKKIKTTTRPYFPTVDNCTATPTLPHTITAVTPDQSVKTSAPPEIPTNCSKSRTICKTVATPEQLTTHTTSTGITLSLGRLRVREGVAFRWVNPLSPINCNNQMGRVYFQGFVLRNKTHYIGDVVRVKTAYIDQTVLILSAFQATKSFQGNAYGDGNHYEIQKRGKYKIIQL